MLTNKGVPTFRNRLQTMALNSLERQIDMCDINSDINKEILMQFLSSAAVGLLEWWITHSMPYPATDMVEQFWLLLEHVQLMPKSLDYCK